MESNYLATHVRAILGLIAAGFLALSFASSAAALTAAEMYDSETIVVIYLDMPPASVAALEADPEGEYVEAGFSLAETDGTPDGIGAFSTPITIGVRLKGEGSFRGLDDKAAFKLKFNEFVGGQKFLGLKKMTLNNMVQDPSMLHEVLAYKAFRAAGVPAPRTGYADVRVNGEEFGLHLNLETMDDVALAQRFGDFDDPQHLYEGAEGLDVSPGKAGEFEVDEGDEGDRSDLEALVEAVNGVEPAPFSDHVAAVADIDEMVRMWAVERYIAHWDGYSSPFRPHNYYLYSDPAGVFQVLPWGTDQTWAESRIGFGPPGPVMFEACFTDVACVARYRSALSEVSALVAELDPGAEAAEIAGRLAPWQQLEVAPRKPFDAEQTAGAVAAVGGFAAVRPAALAKWLDPPTTTAEAVSPHDPPAAGKLAISHRLPIDRARLSRGLLVAWFEAPGPGAVRLTAEIATSLGAVSACTASAQAEEAGPVALRCRLSDRVRRHHASRWIRLRLSIGVELSSGVTASLVRSIRAARGEATGG